MPTPPRKKKRSAHKDAQGAIQPTTVRGVREAARSVTKVSELYGGGETGRLLDGQYSTNRKVERLLQRRHKKSAARGIDSKGVYHYHDHEWKVPGGVRQCIKKSLIWGQVVNQYPWCVVWTGSDGRRKRKLFSTPGGAIHFIATQAQYADPKAAIVSRVVGYDIPLIYVNKIPRPWRWCPYCMTARKFKRQKDGATFNTPRKEWSNEKNRYVWRDRKLAVLVCVRCGCTNKDPRMRRSNQPWETRVIKQGVRRVRRRRR